MIIATSSFSAKRIFFKMFCVRTKSQSRRFQISSGLKSVSEKFRFHDGLVWTEGLTVEVKRRFQISPALVWTGA